ncbi:amino acid adenylation domain-containing protein [Streptomyces sp. NPDC003038]|uniref:amino acid adenylation domain-containing protein n=1 Tax=unclassified Streptomyces TaxID=2593676 RepID=UPI0033A25C7A
MAPTRPFAPERRGATVAPLSPAQERLWFIHQGAPDSAVYNVPLLTRWRERIDLPAFRRALDAVVAAHEVLRTTYGTHEGAPAQFVAPAGPAPLQVIHGESPDEAELARHARAPFDLTGAPPLRCTLWQQPDGAVPGTVLLTVHHIAVDGWSLPALYGALAEAYEQALAGLAPNLPELPVQYADFAVWERAAGHEPALQAQITARAGALAPGAGADLALGVRPPRHRGIGGERPGAQHRFVVAAPLAEAAAELARSLRVTPFVVLFAAFQAVVQRWSGQDEFLLATVAANRPHPSVEGLIGFFVNTVPLRCTPDPQGSFAQLCTDSKGEAFRVLAHQRLPFDRLTAQVARARRGTPGSLADLGFVLQNAPAADPRGRHRWEAPLLLPTGTAKQDLSLVLEYAPDGSLTATVEYDTDRYDAATARDLGDGYRALLAAAVAGPETPLRELPVTDRPAGALPHGVLVGAAPAAAEPPADTVVDLLERRFARTDPDTVAVTCAGAELTWGELDAWSRAVAGLLRGHGIGPGAYVPVLAARGPALVAGWIGVLRAGAAFIPLAMDAPAARLEFILDETAAGTVLVCPQGAEVLAGTGRAVKAVRLAELRGRAGEFPDGLVAPAAADPAAVIYTSGTTGRPKGVLVPHGGLLNTALWWGRDCGLGPGDRLLLTAGTAFDPAAFNVVEALVAGAELVVADDMERRDARALLGLVRGPRGATVAGSITPSLLHAMLEADEDRGSTLRVTYAGGEALPRKLAADCAERWDTAVVNVYGPTEASCNSTYAHVNPGAPGAPPIGVPLPGTRAYVLGPHGEELPPSVPGELYVAGAGVALGYLDRPDLTGAAFLPDPYAGHFGEEPRARMYRTGDRVVLRQDGQLEYLGRADDQLKILGNRIEPGEVTRLIEENPAVAAAAVHAAGEPAVLIAHVELSKEGRATPVTREDLVRPLLRWLPAAVLPEHVYVVDTLPRTVNDKVDVAALAALLDRPLPRAEVRPAELTPAQLRAAGLMADALTRPGGEPVAAEALSPETDFFTVGGHSLLAVRMLAQAERRLGCAVPLRAFLTDPTVAGLARALEEARPQAGRPAAAQPADAAEPRQGSPVQQRLWFLDRLRGVRVAYLAPSVVEIEGPVDRTALVEAFVRTLARHPGLRSRFTLDTAARKVVYRTDGTAPGAVLVDGTGWTAAELEERVAAVCWTPFDLAKDAPARGEVIAVGPDRTLLVYGVHHIVSDGWSLELVLRDLAATYSSLTTGAPLELPAPGHPATAAERAPQAPGDGPQTLLDGLRGAPTDIALPHDRERGRTQSVEADLRELRLTAGASARLKAVAGELSCTTFMVAAALTAAVLARRGGQRDFLFAFPWAGRDGAEHAETVGMFVNTLLVRADLTGDPSWRQLLHRVRTSAMAAYRHADTPFDVLAAALQPDRDLSRPAVTPVYLNAADEAPQPPRFGDRTVSRYLTPPRLKAKYELELTLTGDPDGFRLSLTYLTALFDAPTVEGLLDDLANAAGDLLTDLESPVLTTTPTQDLADRIAEVWEGVLDRSGLAHDMNFFEAGGDSLLLIVLMERLSELSGRELEAADLFEHSTIEAQAAFLGEEEPGAAAVPEETAEPRPAASRTVAPQPASPQTGRSGLLQRGRRDGAAEGSA